METSRYRFEPATNADAPAIHRLIAGVLAEYGLQPHSGGKEADLEDIEAHYFARNGYFGTVRDEAGQIAGTFGLYPLDALRCEIRKMYLLPAVRGQGLGKRMLTALLAMAAERGFATVTLETSRAMQEAIGLYQRFGFREELFDPPLGCGCDRSFTLDLPGKI